MREPRAGAARTTRRDPVQLLVLEDNPGDARLVATMLGDAPEIEIHSAERLAQALEHLSKHRTDVVLLDLGLPDSQGLDTLRAVRRAAPDDPIVVLTGQDDDEIGQAAVREGAQDYVTKNQVVGSTLVRSIRYALERQEHLKRMEHLANVLRAIRGMNQLAGADTEPRALVQRACELLVTEHGYRAVWIALGKAGEPPWRVAHAGWGHELPGLADELPGRDGPPCRGDVVASGQVVPARELAARCRPCPLREACGRAGSLVAPLRHGDSVHGLIGVWPGADVTVRPEEREVLGQVACDVAFALHGNELERRRRASDAQFRVVTETIRDVFWMRAPDLSRIAYVSPGYEKLWGRSCESLVSAPRSFLEAVHPDDRARLVEVLEQKHARGLEYDAEYRIAGAGASTRWIRERGYPVQDERGRVELVAGVCTDVTDLRAASLYARSLIEASLDPLVTIGPDGRITDVNRATEEVTGVPRSRVIGTDFADYFTDPEQARAAHREVLAAGELREYPLTIRHVDGRTTEVLYNASIYSLDGRAQGVFAAARDVTERKRAEAERLRMEEQLRQAQKLEAVGRLAGGVAHDFNNMLTVILVATDFLSREIVSPVPRERIDDIRQAAQRATALTKQLLIFSRKSIVQPRLLDLNAVVASMERMLRRIIGENVQIVTHLEPGVGCVRADPSHLEQVIANLVVNARDAMPDGGTITIETASEGPAGDRDAPPGPGPDRRVVLTVRDTGHGMDADVRSHIFEPFFTTKPPEKGTGLGLSTVYCIVKQAGGDVRVRSAPGAGATFEVVLPRVAGVADPLAGPSAGAAPRGTETILLVEDEPALRELEELALAELGYEVLPACDGEEAARVAAARAGTIHLLVTDVVMPRLGGRALVARLRAERPGMGVLYVSGYSEALQGTDAWASEGAFLQKPFTPDMLARRVREVLDRKSGEPAPVGPRAAPPRPP